MSNSIEKMIFSCEICGSTDCCERTDLPNEPVLCDDCYYEQLEYGECNCNRCVNAFYDGTDKLKCKLSACKPLYL